MAEDFKPFMYRMTDADRAIGYTCQDHGSEATIGYCHRPDSPPLYLCSKCAAAVHAKAGVPIRDC